jgi:hypothetical protein
VYAGSAPRQVVRWNEKSLEAADEPHEEFCEVEPRKRSGPLILETGQKKDRKGEEGSSAADHLVTPCGGNEKLTSRLQPRFWPGGGKSVRAGSPLLAVEAMDVCSDFLLPALCEMPHAALLAVGATGRGPRLFLRLVGRRLDGIRRWGWSMSRLSFRSEQPATL